MSFLCYVLPDDGVLESHLRRRLRRRRIFPETRWYYQRLLEAATSRRDLVSESVLVVMRRVVGGLITDEEVTESTKVLAVHWLRRDQ